MASSKSQDKEQLPIDNEKQTSSAKEITSTSTNASSSVSTTTFSQILLVPEIMAEICEYVPPGDLYSLSTV
ncbi:11742_t:CDS:1, partial [Acaulospora colombiana]